MGIKWFQISGVMFGRNSKTRMHRAFEKFCSDNKDTIFSGLEYLFITGDSGCNSENSDEIIKGINFFQNALGVECDRTFIVAGEKDISEKEPRKTLVEKCLESLNNENIKEIIKFDEDFLNVQEKVSHNKFCSVKAVFEDAKVNIVCLNTAVLTQKNAGMEKSVKLALDYDELLDIPANGKPVIMIAHHNFESVVTTEQPAFEQLLKESNVRLYLCGHNENCSFHALDNQGESKTLWQVHCGSGNAQRENLYFAVGELEEDGMRGEIRFYKYSKEISQWLPYIDIYRLHGIEKQEHLKFHLDKREKSDSVKSIVCTYMDKLYDQCQSNCMGGRSNGRPIPLEEVRIKTKFAPQNNISKKINDEAKENDEADVLLKILTEENKNFYIGAELGGGKTTFMEKLTLKAIDNWRNNISELFPIQIQCRYIDDSRQKVLNVICEYIEKQFRRAIPVKQEMETLIDYVKEKLENNKVLLLIDGLDEIVDDSDRKILLDNLEKYIQEKQLGHIVVSSRIDGYKGTYDIAISFEKLMIAQWSDEDIREFCADWCKENKMSNKQCAQIIDSVMGSENILKLARNPLLLTSMLLSRKNNANFPQKRSDVYREAVECIESWNSDWHKTWDFGVMRIILAYIAFYMTFIKRQSSTIGKKDLRSKLLEAPKIDALRELKEIENKVWVDEFLKCAEQSSGVLIEKGFQTNKKEEEEPLYIFRHQGFQAYLAAYALVHALYLTKEECSSLEILKKHHVFDKENMGEALIIAAELSTDLGRQIVEELYSKIENMEENYRYPYSNANHLEYCKRLIIQLLLDGIQVAKEQRIKIYKIVFEKISVIQIEDIKKLTKSKLADEFACFVANIKEDAMQGKASYDLPIMYEFCIKNYNGEDIYREYKKMTKSRKIEKQKLAMMYADVGIMLSLVGYNFNEQLQIDMARKEIVNDFFIKMKSKDMIVAGAAAASLTCFLRVTEDKDVKETLYNSPELLDHVIKAAVATDGIYIMVLCRYFDMQNSRVQEICRNQTEEVKNWIRKAYIKSRGHSQKIGSFWMCVVSGLWTNEEAEQKFKEITTMKRIYKTESEKNEIIVMWEKYMRSDCNSCIKGEEEV